MVQFSSTKRKIVKNALFNSLAWALKTGFHLVLISLITSKIGKEEFGLYSLALSLIGYFSLIQGLNQATQKYISEYHTQDDRRSIEGIIGASLFISLVIGIIGMVLIYSLSEILSTHIFEIPKHLRREATIIFKIISCGFLATSLSFSLMSIPMALQRFDLVSKVIVYGGLLSFIVSLSLVLNESSIMWFVLILIIITILNIVVYYVISRKLLNNVHIRPSLNMEYLSKIIRFAKYSISTSIVSVISSGVDRFVIGVTLGTTAVGNYYIAQAPAVQLAIFSTKLLEIILPVTSQLTTIESNNVLSKLFLKASTYNLLINLSFFIPIIFASYQIISIWIDPETAQSVFLVMSMLGLAFFIRSLGGVAAMFNLGINRPGRNTKYAIISTMITLIAIFPLLRYFGLIGVSIAVLLGALQVPFFIYNSLKTLQGVNTIKYLKSVILKPFLIGLVQAGYIVIFKDLFIINLFNLFFLILSSMFISIILAIVFNVVEEDWRKLIFKKIQ